jgi:hypothetical protein
MHAHPDVGDASSMATRHVPRLYEIRVRGLLGDTLLASFPTFRAESRGAETILSGPIADQAALHGVLALIESLGLELISVTQLREGGDR